MFTGAEIPAIIAVVEGLISAFHNAQAIIARYKDSRKKSAKSAPPQVDDADQLERSVRAARAEIFNEATKGEDRLGEAFKIGDTEAVLKLQHILIQLNELLVGRLLAIQRGEAQGTDLQDLRAVADLVRDEAVMELIQLRQRLDREQRARRGKPSDAPSLYAQSGSSSQDIPQTTPPASPIERIDRTTKTSENTFSAQREARRTGANTGPSHSYSTLGIDIGQVPPKASGKKRAESQTEPQRKMSRDQRPGSSPHMAGARTPSSIISNTSTSPSNLGARSEQRRATAPEIPGMRRHSVYSFYSLDGISLEGSQSLPIDLYADPEPVSVPRPTSQNDYLGLCKGAVKLWNGEKAAVNFGLDYSYRTSQANTYAAYCSKSLCTFKHACDRANVWKTVIVDRARGIQYRWSFLAKSHVEHRRPAPNGEFLYQCLFCTFLKYPRKEMTKNQYLKHVDLEHRGSNLLHSVILYNTCCVSGHECTDLDDFDINLLPLTPEEKAARRPLNFRDSVIGAADEFAAAFPPGA